MVSVMMWPEHEFRMVVDALELVVDGLEREKAENAKLRALVKDIDKRLADEIERLNTCLPLIEAAYRNCRPRTPNCEPRFARSRTPTREI